MKLTIEIHRSLRSSTAPKHYSKHFSTTENYMLQQAIELTLQSVPEISGQIFNNHRVKPGLLFFSGKTELNSLGLLDTPLDSSNDITITIVPIMHGG